MTTHDASLADLKLELERLGGKARLPSSPAIAAQILELTEDPRSTPDQYARLVEADPGLAARILQHAGTTGFAERRQFTTIQRAMTALGARQVRVTVLGFDLADQLDRIADCPFDLPRFWRLSVLRACLARSIARAIVPRYADEAFVIGLLQDCGMPVLVQMLGDAYADLVADDGLTPPALHAEERARFPFTHQDVITVLADQWRLPETIARPLARHHGPTAPEGRPTSLDRLCALSHFVGSLSCGTGRTIAPVEPGLLSYAKTQLGLEAGELSRILDDSTGAWRTSSEMFDRETHEAFSPNELLIDANRQLFRIASETETRSRQASTERDEMLDERVSLHHVLGQYREQAKRDPLTELLNRRALLELTIEDLRRRGRPNGSIAVLFLDIDNFKRTNDLLGHQVGDRVLRKVAECVRESTGAQGFAGRYGGEELISVLRDLEPEDVRRRAADLLESIRVAEIPELGEGGYVTCSLGAVWVPLLDAPKADDLFREADKLMYVAKRSGKDRGCFRSLKAPEAVFTIGLAKPSEDHQDPGDALSTVDPNRHDPARFRRVAAELDREQTGRFASVRKQERRSLPTECTLHHVTGRTGSLLDSEIAFVRTISTGGIGLLAAQSFARGDLLEVELDRDGRKHYLAGLVAFSRLVRDGIHEVGVQLFDRADEPVLSADPAGAIRRLDWACDANLEVDEQRLRSA